MEDKCKNCRLDIPYPSVENVKCDNRTVRMLCDAYTGAVSELGAISEYSYQTIILENEFPVAADILECISVTEMKHFHCLGRLILGSGIDPAIRFSGRGGRQKTGLRPITVDEGWFRNAILTDIAAENDAVRMYEEIAHEASSGELKAIINRIILDERHHAELLTDLLS